MTLKHSAGRTILGMMLLISPLLTHTALAVPSFARQTGMSCEACHTIFPELTHFGRMFKANGYTLTSLPQVRDIGSQSSDTLSLNQVPPLSIMAEAAVTSLAKALPDSSGIAAKAQNETVAFPQQLSLFYAGRIAPHLGVFGQLTYSNAAATIQIDNTDFRFSNVAVLGNDQSLIYGLSLNNNPTLSDLWNSTPAFGFPYQASNANVPPLAKTAIDGGFAQNVAGLSAYAFWNESLYAEVGAYRSAKQGFANKITGGAGPLDGAATNVIDGVAPYWRIAYEYQRGPHSLEVGAYGMSFHLFPGGSTPAAPTALVGPTNDLTDIAQDLQYQYLGDPYIVTVAATRIHENATFNANFAAGATANLTDQLTTTRVSTNLIYRRKYEASLGYFATTGTTDPGLFAMGPSPGVVGSANGSPNTSGWITELDYIPWLNVKIAAQYTAFLKFNGSSMNYDGFGRNASGNNTFYFLLWLAY